MALATPTPPTSSAITPASPRNEPSRPTSRSSALASLACGSENAPRPAGDDPRDLDAQAGVLPRTVLFLGTSLTAGYGLDPQQAYPALIGRRIEEAGLPHRVVNAGVSGETSAGALRRIDWLLRQPFEVLVLETGANDMLRGADLEATRDNLQALVDRVRTQRPEVRIVLVALRAPPNLGAAYGRRFAALYAELARDNDLPLVPFLLEGVGGRPELNLPDGVHPNAAGQRRLAENVWKVLRPVLEG
ncbi:MAG: arylesterase [Gemmatimonadota bacterium]